MSSNSKSNKKETKNIKALFSVVCICIIALGLIVYFSTNSKSDNDTVNEATTIEETTKEITTDVQHAVTVTETTEKTTSEKTTEKSTEPSTMEQNETNTPYKSFYKYPLTEAVLNGYSEELVYDETMGDYRAHAAVDFSGNTGDEVTAINDGLVLNVYTDNLYGTVVEIDHGGTLIARYCGLESVTVKKGSYVNIGNKIGTLGSVPIEGALASHLHFECTYDSKAVNPLDAMGKTE